MEVSSQNMLNISSACFKLSYLSTVLETTRKHKQPNWATWSSCDDYMVQNCLISLFVAAHHFEFLYAVSMIGFLVISVSVSAHLHASKTQWALSYGGWIGTYPSPCLRFPAPPLPSLAFFIFHFSFLPSYDLRKSSGGAVFQNGSISSSLAALCCVNIEKTPNLLLSDSFK